MLKFFRRHQKLFFIVITTAVVISFCFFGTYGTLAESQETPNHSVGKGVGGREVRARKFSALCRVLSSSVLDKHSEQQWPNLLNPGVIEHDFLATGLALSLVKPYFSQMKSEWDQRIAKVHQFTPYSHPQSETLNALGMWGLFSKPLPHAYQQLKARSDQATLESFFLMTQVYLSQLALPPVQTLRQMLWMQEQQKGLAHDPLLEQADLSVFGFKSLEEWFGPRFVPLVAGFITNVAHIAQEHGYQVSNEQVRKDLLHHVSQGYVQLTRQEALSGHALHEYYVAQMRQLGLEEATLLDAWRDVLLFRRLVEDTSSSILLDPLVYAQFEQFSEESVEVDIYSLPEEFRFTDLFSMLKFQLYMESVSTEGIALRKSAGIPQTLASIEQIEKRAPSLVEQSVTLQWRSVDRAELEAAISLKQTWQWEIEDKGWRLLQGAFGQLQKSSAATPEQRLAALAALVEETRMEVDLFAKKQMVQSDPERINAALAAAPVHTQNVGLRPQGNWATAIGVKQSDELMALVRDAAIHTEPSNLASHRLHPYLADDARWISIDVLSRSAEKRCLSFKEAMADGTLEQMLTDLLEKHYVEGRKKHPASFQTAQGELKSFESVKEEIAQKVFADLLEAIKEQYRAHHEGAIPQVIHAAWYSTMRLYEPFVQLREQTIAHSQDFVLPHPVLGQWHLEKQSKQMARSETPYAVKQELFALPSHSWSAIYPQEKGGLCFYAVQGKGAGRPIAGHCSEEGQRILAEDVKKDLMQHVLHRIHQDEGVNLLTYLEEQVR